jgi:DNA-binding transcriptional ArsR family regulator
MVADPDQSDGVRKRSAASDDFGSPTIACILYIHYSRYMDNNAVIDALSALAQTTRLDTFRLLVSREPDGVAAGELARLIAIPQNTMSTHLAILARAGLVRGERHSRSIIYCADLQRFRDVILFLLKDCCGGRPEICAPLIADLTPCCLLKECAYG